MHRQQITIRTLPNVGKGFPYTMRGRHIVESTMPAKMTNIWFIRSKRKVLERGQPRADTRNNQTRTRWPGEVGIHLGLVYLFLH